MAIEFLAVAIGVMSVLVLVLVSVRGPCGRDPRLPGNGGAFVPLGDDSDGT